LNEFVNNNTPHKHDRQKNTRGQDTKEEMTLTNKRPDEWNCTDLHTNKSR